MAWTIFDYILFAVMAFVVGVGLFRGLSGELGSLAGFAAAAAAGYFLFGAAKAFAVNVGFAGHGEGLLTGTAAVIDFVFALIAYGLTRGLVAKFVSCMLPQPTNALLGALGGVFKCLVLLGVLTTGAGFFVPGEYATSLCAENSVVIRLAAGWADAFVAGAAR